MLGRPYHLTFEIIDKSGGDTQSLLRIVPAAELYSHIAEEDADELCEEDITGKVPSDKDGVQYEVVGADGKVVMRTNREIFDEPTSQKLTMDEIELMKKQETGSGKDLIAKILESHSAIEQKTAFALAKYTLRKTKKYMRRFKIMPLDVSTLTNWLLNEKEPMKIMELRDEMLGLISSWSNVHYGIESQLNLGDDGMNKVGAGRWLLVDETGGLLVAAMAERMSVLYPSDEDEASEGNTYGADDLNQEAGNMLDKSDTTGKPSTRGLRPTTAQRAAMGAQTNTITVIHANAQPNLSLLKYFGFDSTNPQTSHPLYTHLKTLSWLQLLSPDEDTAYAEPEVIPDETLQKWKGGKRGNYYRKRRRWERIKSVVDETRAGGFDGLVVASVMNPATILHYAVPHLRGAAQVVVYSPNVEPLAELVDCYTTARRAAFITNPANVDDLPNEDFPANPTLLLAPTIITARCRSWQVLPGRTHPLMTGRGCAEGYIFTATRVLPAEGKVEARGKFKRRKTGANGASGSSELHQDIKVNEVEVAVAADLDSMSSE